MAKWTKKKVTPEEINNGNEYSVNDNLSVESINAIINNSFKAQEDSEEALKKANSAYEGNGTLVKINGENQATWDATISQKISEESLNELDIPNTTITSNGATVTTTNGEIVINGTPTSTAVIDIPINLNVGTETYTYAGFNDISKGYSSDYIAIRGENDTTLFSNSLNSNNKTFNASSSSWNVFRIRLGAGNTYNNYVVKPMLVKGNIVPPKFGTYNQNRHITNSQAEYLKEISKDYLNLLYGLLTIPEKTQNNATYSLINGTLSVSGTPSANTFEYLTDYIKLKAGTYFFTFESNKDTGCRLITGDGSSVVSIAEKNKPFTLTTDRNDIRVQMRLGSGGSFDGATFKNFAILEGDWTGKTLPNYGVYNEKMHISNGEASILSEDFKKEVNEIYLPNKTKNVNGAYFAYNNGVMRIDGTPSSAINYTYWNNNNSIIGKRKIKLFYIGGNISNQVYIIIRRGTDKIYQFNIDNGKVSNNNVYEMELQGDEYLFFYMGSDRTATNLKLGITISKYELDEFYPYNSSPRITNNETDFIKKEFKNSGNLLNDAIWQIGTIASGTGLNNESNKRVRNANYIPLEQKDYTLTFTGMYQAIAFFYDTNMAYLGNHFWFDSGTTLNIPENTAYVRFVFKHTNDSQVVYSTDELTNAQLLSENRYVRKNEIKSTTLWENATPEVSFTTTGTELFLTKIPDAKKRLFIEFKSGGQYHVVRGSIFRYNNGREAYLIGHTDSGDCFRKFKISDNRVIFYDAYIGSTINNAVLIPYRIYELNTIFEI